MNKGKGKLEEIAGPSGVGQGSGYQLRIHIIEARDLKGRDASGQSDPVCVVSALGKKDKTVIHKKTTICVWDHLFIWEFPKMGENEFLGGTVQVDVYDANTLLRNEMIGRFEINLGYVYKTEGHEVYRRWVALADPTDKFEGVQGYLRLSVTALSSNDVAPVHTEDEEEDEEQNSSTNLQAMVLLPPSIQVEERMLNVRIYSVEGLPKLDTFGTCDPFVQAKFAGLTIKTETKDKQQNATFNENLQIPVNIPVMAEEIQITVWDFDAVGKNEIIATVLIKFSEVQEGKWNTPRWVNLYGSPYPEESRKIKEMNFGFVEASAYRGRLLLSLDSQPTKDGKLAKVPIGPPTAPPNRDYIAFLDLFEGAKLDTDDSSVDVELTVGSQTVFSKKTKVGKENKAVWYENVQPLQLSLPMDITQCPDIFINVFRHVPLVERKRVGLLRISAQEAYDNSRSEPKWSLLSRDILIDGTKFSGFLLCKLAFNPAIENIPRSPVDPPVLRKYQLRAFIYQAKNLFAADDNGLSDPYCVVHLGGEVKKTKIEKETVFPQWYESLSLDVQLPENLNIAPSISILLYDHDMFSADDLLGLVHVPITSVTAAIQPPKWYSLFLNNQDFGKNLRGELLASFQLLPSEQADIPLPNIKPASREASIDFGIIGMRNLLPYALQPIQNSYVEIRCGRDAAVRTKPSKKPSGSNPNFLETLEIPVKLPEDPIYSPVVEVKVFDNRVIYKPLIGATSIAIDRLIPWAKIQSEIEEIPDNAEVPQAPVEDVVAEAPEGAEEKVPSATIVDIQEPINPDNSGWFEGKDGKGKAPGVEMSSGPLLQQNEEIHIAIEEVPKSNNQNEELANSGSDASQPLLGGKNRKDFNITLPNMALRTLAAVQDKIPLGLEVMEKEAEEEASNTGGVPRARVQKELERYYKPSFDSWNLFKGKQAGLGLIKKPSYTVSGQLKGQLRVNDGESEPLLSLQELFQPLPYVLRLYVLRGIGLNPKDANGLCDPYVVIYTNGANGRKLVIKDIEEMKKETLNPNFFKCYEINVSLPGDSELEIEVWDWDQVGGDDLVGSTVIDLENRQYSQEWRQLDPKPIEARRLSSPLSSNSQGQLELWLDIMTPSEAAATPKIEISPPLPRNFELRMVIWNTKEVTFKDAKMSDIFVVGYIEGKEPQKTDIHWRSEDGEGMFNWRMVFPVTLPYKNPRLKIQIWDKDLLNPNDVIAEASLNLRSFFRKAFKDRNKSMHSVERQFITLTHPNFPGPQGRVEISIDMILEEEARKNPVGLGRNDPNHSPHLPKPDRPDTSFNPLNPMSYLSKVMWKQNKGKVICICVCIGVVILFPVILFIINSITKFI